jgi:glycosyltransferase involved in cell wall biosynthesis/predicted metal-dependent phosphoesterase TrpH
MTAINTHTRDLPDTPIDRTTRLVRMDTHVHSSASSKPVIAAAGIVGAPESYSDPERVFEQAKARGMDLVTITDHDTIAGAMTLVHKNYPDFVVGQEVSVRFPEDQCLLHVLVWNLTPELDEQITTLGLRDDVYDFAAWLAQHRLPHSLAHPLYVQNAKLTPRHIERCALLFKNFETINGAHDNTLNTQIARYAASLTPKTIQRLIDTHDITPHWPRIWEKGQTGGSDDHALLNIGRTWTQIPFHNSETPTATEFVKRIGQGLAQAGGIGGHTALLAHQITTVGAQHFARTGHHKRSPAGRYASAKLLRFFGATAPAPTKARLIASYAWKKAVPFEIKRRRSASTTLPLLLKDFKHTLDRHPALKANLDPDTWSAGPPVSQHDEMASFVADLITTMSATLNDTIPSALANKQYKDLAKQLQTYAMLQLAQLPYIVSLYCQNKERAFVQDFARHTSTENPEDTTRPTRVLKFTDTLCDVNGVCRFIQNTANTARRNNRDLTVFTSSRIPLPPTVADAPNVRNFTPIFAMKMPKYETLDLALPPLLEMLRAADELRPDVIHISTPGPVGMVGMLAAKLMRVPVVGVYHTDFPAYVDELFDDHVSTTICKQFMSLFYRQFRAVFSRSSDYANRLKDLGLDENKLVKLKPGFDNHQFSRDLRDDSIWDQHNVPRDAIKILFCGRVSTEKNLPLLVDLWPDIKSRIEAAGKQAHLIIIGDGPYRTKMAKRLEGLNAHFLGFRHGPELAALYASCDCFAFPSTTDTLGQVVMEAQASGVPVVATNEGGPKEVIDHNHTGYVLPIDDPTAWTDAIVQIATDDALRQRMSKSAVEHMKQFSFDESFAHYWNIHEHARAAPFTKDTPTTTTTTDPEHTENEQAAEQLNKRRAPMPS